jgi:hypothetical protein
LASISGKDALMNEFERWPHLIMEECGVKLTVLLPDPLRGYYRGPRFDWAGTVALAEWNGHTFLGSWRSAPHQPRANDDTAGTAGEFGMGPLTGNPPPIGYEDADIGETFLKVGVGRLVKTAAEPYSFGALYRIARPASWDIRLGERSISFVQDEGLVRGQAFRYSKTIEVEPSMPGFAVHHVLENTGELAILQTHYCHNFIRIDERPVGREYAIELAFAAFFGQEAGGVLEAKGRTITLRRDPGPEEGFFALLEGFGGTTEHAHVTVRAAGTGVRISVSEPICRFQVFGTGRTICPEPFVRIDLAPGKAMRWSIRYEFLEEYCAKCHKV